MVRNGFAVVHAAALPAGALRRLKSHRGVEESEKVLHRPLTLTAMPVITKISEQKRRPNRRSVFLDGRFAFGCSVNVIARFRLREGVSLSDEMVRDIEQGVVKQECFDKAMSYLQSRLHSRAELERKLKQQEWGEAVIAAVLDDLVPMGYLDDERFAKTKALVAAETKKHGRRRAFVELMRSGVKDEVATKAL